MVRSYTPRIATPSRCPAGRPTPLKCGVRSSPVSTSRSQLWLLLVFESQNTYALGAAGAKMQPSDTRVNKVKVTKSGFLRPKRSVRGP